MMSSRAQVADSVRAMGKSAFMQTCESCHHDTINALIPAKIVLSTMTPRAVLAAMETGKMRIQASGLSPVQRKAIAEWITGAPLKSGDMPKTAYTPFQFAWKFECDSCLFRMGWRYPFHRISKCSTGGYQ